MKKIIDVRVLAEIAILTAISFVLHLIQKAIFSGIWVNGGSIAFSIIPIIVLCYRRGFVPGLICSLIVMIINFAGGIYSIADVWYKVMLQILLDYVLAMPLLAVAGIFYKPFKNAKTVKEKNIYLLVGTICAILAQFVAYFLSGVLFWPTPAEGWNVPAGAVYSLLYNGSYTILTLPICTAIILLIYKRAPQLIEPELKEISNEK